MADLPHAAVARRGPFELWFVAQLTMGIVYAGGAMFLLPAFTLSLEDSTPGDVGLVMALLPLVALSAPLVGGLLDRFGSFRIFQLLGLGLFALGFGVLALADELVGTAVGSLILGVGAALVLTTNLSMLAGSGLSGDVLTARMAQLQMAIPAGQVIGLAIVAGMLAVEASFELIFVTMAGIAALGLAATALTAGPAEKRALAHMATAEQPAVRRTGDLRVEGIGAMLFSSFGLVLLVVFLTMAAHATIESQYPNVMDEVFGIDGDLAAAGLAVAVLASVPVYPIVGRWAQRVAYRVPLLVGVAIRGAAGLALWLLADAADLPAVVPLAIYGAIVVALPLTDVTGALLAATTSPIGPGGGQGGYGFALAAAAIAGALMAGWVADELGYRSLALIVAILSAVALALGVLLPRPRAQHGRRPDPT